MRFRNGVCETGKWTMIATVNPDSTWRWQLIESTRGGAHTQGKGVAATEQEAQDAVMELRRGIERGYRTARKAAKAKHDAVRQRMVEGRNRAEVREEAVDFNLCEACGLGEAVGVASRGLQCLDCLMREADLAEERLRAPR